MKKLVLAIALAPLTAGIFSEPTAADSTAGLLVSLRCRGGYNVQIWQENVSRRYLYRTRSPHSNLNLSGGTSQAIGGVRVYKFRNGTYKYRVWVGPPDSLEAGTLEVYENNRILMQQPCWKI
jgi:hypothetical protein